LIPEQNLFMNSVGYFEIQSSQPERDVRFYSAVFGWKLIKQDFIPIEYYRIETGGISGGLLKRLAKVPPLESGTNAYVCSIQVEYYDQTHQRIIENGGQVALPKFAIPGRCWQGYYIDLDNNTFGIFEVDDKAR